MSNIWVADRALSVRPKLWLARVMLTAAKTFVAAIVLLSVSRQGRELNRMTLDCSSIVGRGVMRAILLGRRIMPSDRGSTHWVAIADYIVGDQLADIPLGPKTKGLGEYPVATARETANEEAKPNN
jgi:hypothetical protein